MANFTARIAVDLLKNETGATGIEYGFIASLIAVALVSGFEGLGNGIDETFGYVEEEVSEATG